LGLEEDDFFLSPSIMVLLGVMEFSQPCTLDSGFEEEIETKVEDINLC
jgi:hypothetical protein